MLEIVLATKNAHKEKEYRELLKINGVKIIPLSQIQNGEKIRIIESGNTFKENAVKKAFTVAKATNTFVLADDSGLEVDAINGRPGVFSRRFAGIDATDEGNINLLLRMMKGIPIPRRQARFHCVIALAWPGGAQVITTDGTCEGLVLEHSRGENGFGYDPIFYIREKKCSMAELPLVEKNRLSHRYQAFEKMRAMLVDLEKNWKTNKLPEKEVKKGESHTKKHGA